MPVSQQHGNRGEDTSLILLFWLSWNLFNTTIFCRVLSLTQSIKVNGLECVIQNQFSFSLFSLSFLHQLLPVYKPDTEVT